MKLKIKIDNNFFPRMPDELPRIVYGNKERKH